MSVVHGNDAMVKAIVHAGGLPCRIAREPLAVRWSYVHFHDRSAKFRSRRKPDAGHHDPARKEQSKSGHAQAYHATDRVLYGLVVFRAGGA